MLNPIARSINHYLLQARRTIVHFSPFSIKLNCIKHERERKTEREIRQPGSGYLRERLGNELKSAFWDLRICDVLFLDKSVHLEHVHFSVCMLL